MAQTNPVAQPLPYTQNFSSLTPGTVIVLPAGWASWQIGAAGSISYRTTAPTGDKVLVPSGTAASNTGTAYNYLDKPGFLNSGSFDGALALALNTTGRVDVVVQYDVMTIRNPYDGTTNTRFSNLTLQYRIGTSGVFTTLFGAEYINTTTAQTTAVTTPQNLQNKSYTLPAACNNQPVVQVRWLARDLSGSGGRPSFAIDNISVSSVACANAAITSTTGAGAVCSTSDLMLGVIATGTVPLSYAWSGPGGTYSPTSSVANPTVSGPVTGNYQIDVTNACGNTASAQVAVTVTPAPNATISYTGSPYHVCSALGPVTLSGTSGGSFTATPAGLNLNSATGEVTLPSSTPGTYTVTYTIAASGACAQFQATAPLTVLAAPTANAGGPYLSSGASTVPVLAAANGPGYWSGGTGSFGNANNTSTTYTLGAGEAGTAFTITWTTYDPDGAGSCTAVSSTAQFVGGIFAGGNGRGDVQLAFPNSVGLSQFLGGSGRGDVQLAFPNSVGLSQFLGGSGRGDVQLAFTNSLGLAQFLGGSGRGDVQLAFNNTVGLSQFLGGSGRGDVQLAFTNTLGLSQFLGGSGRGDVQLAFNNTVGLSQYMGGSGRGDVQLAFINSVSLSQYLGGSGRGDVQLAYVVPLVPVPAITTNVPSTTICPSFSVPVSFTANGTYNTGNVFTAQLSDAMGSFASPTSIGTLSGQLSSTIAAIIPVVPAGTGYRIRVVSSNPVITGSDNGVNLSLSPIYYSRAMGNVDGPVWSTTPTGTAGLALWNQCASMVVQSGHVITSTGSMDLANLDVQAGGTLVLNSNTTFNVWGTNATFSGTLTAQDNSTIVLKSDTAPVALSTTGTPSLYDLTIATAGGTTATGNVDMRGTLQLDKGAFDATAAAITLRSTATYTGRLGPVSPSASYIGNMKVERYIPGGATNWRLLGSPLANRKVVHWQDDFITAGYPGSQYPNFDDPVGSGILWPSIRWYDETDPGPAEIDGLVGVSSNQQFLLQGQGFAVWCGDNLGGTAPFIVDVQNAPPHIANTPITLPMSWTDNGTPEVDGWNLVSNPLPSAIAFDQIARGANVEDYVTFYNPANGNTAVYDISLNMGSNGATNTIQSSQGFFLKANGPDTTTTVEEGDKINDNGGGVFGGLVQNVAPMLHLRIASAINSYNDEAYVVFNVGTPQLDGEDAAKYVFAHPAAPQVATLAPTGEQLVFNCFGALDASFFVPVSVNAGVTGTYTITVAQIGELDLTCIVLKDLVTNTITTLTGSDSYSFFLDATADPNVPRFQLKAVLPEAGFTTTTGTVAAGEQLAFTNTSTNTASSSWDFGDGSTSTAVDPTHVWNTPGTYDVTLTTTTGSCTDVEVQQVIVTSPVPGAALAARIFLEGPYSSAFGTMNDALRSAGLIPLTEPYTALGYAFVSGGGETTTAPVLSATGNQAIVDWVLVELRDANNATHVIASQSALLQRDGDVVGTDGVSALFFNVPSGNYYVAVLHRNHLAVMSRLPLALNTAALPLDFTLASTDTYGTAARKSITGTFPAEALWAGDVNGDGTIKYTGSDNDRDRILLAIGGSIPTNFIDGTYAKEDVNMDGRVMYTGNGNDRDRILENIGGVIPTNVRTGQIP